LLNPSTAIGLISKVACASCKSYNIHGNASHSYQSAIAIVFRPLYGGGHLFFSPVILT